MDFLKDELKNLIIKSKKNNLILSSWSIESSWASSNHLLMYLKALEDIVNLKNTKKWDWVTNYIATIEF